MRKFPSNTISLVLAAGIAVAVARAQTYPHGFWGFILTNEYLLPLLAVLFVFLVLYGLSGMHVVSKLLWRIFTFLVPPIKPNDLPKPSKLEIISAKYGSEERGYHNRKETVESQILGDSLSLLVGRELLGDPPNLEGHSKELIVKYSFDGGEPLTAKRPQSARLNLPEDPWLLDQIEHLRVDAEALPLCQKEMEKQRREYEKVIEGVTYERDIARRNARADVLSTITPEAHYLIEQLEQIKDWNEKENPDSRVDLLYPLTGNQIGEDRTKWKWQQELLIKWHTAYDRFCEYCKRLKVNTQLPPLRSATSYSKLIRSLENVERGDFPESPSSEAT